MLKSWRPSLAGLSASARFNDVIVADLRRTEAERGFDSPIWSAPFRTGGNGQNGKDIEPAAVRAMVDEAVAALPAPAPGRDADPAVVAQMVGGCRSHSSADEWQERDRRRRAADREAAVKEAVAALPAPAPGEMLILP